jgi:XTP/dITP diphosphohydrolase
MIVAPRLLIATSNQGKLREFLALVPEGVEVVSLGDLGLPAPDETGVTFTENADLKALDAAQRSGLLALADDSGLQVDALGGAPGVFSSRYTGEPPDDRRNLEKVIDELRAQPGAIRSARFRCAISIASPTGVLARSEGVCEGLIAGAPRGSNGFGYDPIFVLPDGRTLAEYRSEEKNRVSHRARAIAAITPVLRKLLDQARMNAR